MGIEQIHSDKRTVMWGYAATILSIASGLITLPLLLRLLSEEEIAVNYLFMTITGFILLFDVGFTPQISRNLTFIFSGAQKLEKEGYHLGENTVNYRLLSSLIVESKQIYRRISLVVLLVLLLIGTPYMYSVTKESLPQGYMMPVWTLYVVTTTLQMYYYYFTAFMEGKGLVSKNKQIIVLAQVLRITLVAVTLIAGFKLWSVVIGNLTYILTYTLFARYFFYTEDIKKNVSSDEIEKSELKDTFETIWYNAKKTAIIYLAGFFITKSNLFLSSLYLSLADVASFGLLMQFISLICRISENFYLVSQPEIISLRVQGKTDQLKAKFSMTIVVYMLLFFAGGAFLAVCIPPFLRIIGSNASLPSTTVVVLYCIIIFLERNHSTFAAFIATGNKINFLESSVIAAFAIVGFSFLELKYTTYGLLGLILVQGIVQLVYANWKWPYEVMKELHLTYPQFLKIGMSTLCESIKRLVKK